MQVGVKRNKIIGEVACESVEIWQAGIGANAETIASDGVNLHEPIREGECGFQGSFISAIGLYQERPETGQIAKNREVGEWNEGIT